MSSRWSALLSSSRPTPTTLPPLHRRASPPPHSVPRSLHEPSTGGLVPGQASADSPGPFTESPVRSPGAVLSEQQPVWSPSPSLPWLESDEYGVEDGQGERGTSMLDSNAARAVRTSSGPASQIDARRGPDYTFAPPPEQRSFDERAQAYEPGEAVQDEAPAPGDIGGEFTFSFDSPVLVATRAAGEHGFEHASPDAHVPYSPSEHLEPVSPISPLSGVVEQGRPAGGSYFPQQAEYAVPPSSSLYQGPASAPTYSHEPYYPGAASYPPSFAAAPVPLSMAAYQSFAYAQTSTSSEHYVSATAYDDGDDGTSGYSGFAPPPSSSFHPSQARRISTGGIFPHFYSPSRAPATYRYVRAPSPPRSPASLLAVNLPFVGSTSPPLVVKAELEEVDLPSPPTQLPQAPTESLYGSPMSASSLGSGGLSAWSLGVGSPSGDSGGDGPGASSSAPQRNMAQHAQRRISRARDDLDPDYEPSPPPEAHPKLHSSSSRPISPITGKPVKKISKRGWPPKDAHKRVFVCEVVGCGKKCASLSSFPLRPRAGLTPRSLPAVGRPSARDTHMRSHTGVKRASSSRSSSRALQGDLLN